MRRLPAELLIVGVRVVRDVSTPVRVVPLRMVFGRIRVGGRRRGGDEEDKDEDEDEDDLSGAVSGSQMETIKLKSSLRAAAASFLLSAAISP